MLFNPGGLNVFQASSKTHPDTGNCISLVKNYVQMSPPTVPSKQMYVLDPRYRANASNVIPDFIYNIWYSNATVKCLYIIL